MEIVFLLDNKTWSFIIGYHWLSETYTIFLLASYSKTIKNVELNWNYTLGISPELFYHTTVISWSSAFLQQLHSGTFYMCLFRCSLSVVLVRCHHHSSSELSFVMTSCASLCHVSVFLSIKEENNTKFSVLLSELNETFKTFKIFLNCEVYTNFSFCEMWALRICNYTCACNMN